MPEFNSPPVHHPILGKLQRAVTPLPGGDVLNHEWYSTLVMVAGASIEIMVRATEPDAVRALLPRVVGLVVNWPTLHRTASDAVVHALGFEITESELNAAEEDLILATIEAGSGGEVILHLNDKYGEHFPEGYWPAVHLDAEDHVIRVTVDA